ncbi:MAG TPA: hypothetical protein VFM51_01575 [Solirubrobacterales bacterium]|nr:hypothetical protein [Solirubrobacterales bacterium]
MESSCAICGRTILAGERVHDYLDREQCESVCDLCTARAERIGWRAASAPESDRQQDRGHEGRGRLSGLLRRRPRRSGAPAAPSPATSPDPAAPSRRPRAAPPGDEAMTPFQRAVARFNSSEAGRTVAGLTRTLGAPWVSVGASAGAPAQVRVTVAWELSWYQWGVDVDDELRPVFELDKGSEIDQLDAAARQWNASLGEDGRLRLAGEPASSR